MDLVIGIELTNSEYHDIIAPFLPIVPSFKERLEVLYIFTSLEEVNDLKGDLAEFDIIESIHMLYSLKCPTLYHNFDDYGFHSMSGHYLLENMTTKFTIVQGSKKDIEMALLQFDEHLIAKDEAFYYVDFHYRELIENIAKAYNISIRFFELDK